MSQSIGSLPFNGYMFDSSFLPRPQLPEPLLVAVCDAAYMLAVKEVTIRKWISKGKILSVKLNNARRIPMTEIKRLVFGGQKTEDLTRLGI